MVYGIGYVYRPVVEIERRTLVHDKDDAAAVGEEQRIGGAVVPYESGKIVDRHRAAGDHHLEKALSDGVGRGLPAAVHLVALDKAQGR